MSNIDTNKLSRLVSVPGGGEATGLQLLENLEGYSYLMLSAQNPGYVGYLSGIPAVSDVQKKNSK
jgi:hypothetical protein